MHVCLEHRPEPLGCFGSLHGSLIDKGGPQPLQIEDWPSVEAYTDTWRCLSFMDAVTNAISDNDSKTLGSVTIKWTMEDGVSGTFNVASELKDAQKLSIRADDLLCVRWQTQTPRGNEPMDD